MPKPKGKTGKAAERDATVVENEAPLSETLIPKRHDGSKQACIEDLRELAKNNPDVAISRNFYRVHGTFAESNYTQYFGTFLEYKRQANIILSRHAHRMERDIAKHASKDRVRSMNEEKRSWEGTYLRPSSKRWQTVLVGSDMHDVLCDPFYRRLFIDTARRAQPEKIVLNGDIFDLTEFGKYTQDPRDYRVVERMTWVHKLLSDLREACPEAEITFVEGNHEYRLLRHLCEATPALVTVLSDLHGMSVPDLLGLTRYEINYVARMDLSGWNEADIKKELRKNYVICYDALLFHHFPDGFSMGYPGANGHHHAHLVRHAYSPIFGPYEWHQLGAGHIRSASYCAAEKWSNGFLLCHVDTHTRRTQFDYADTSHEHCMIGGKFYEREDGEKLAY